MIDNTIEQRSIAWYRSRLGNITGSKVADIMGKGKASVFSKTGESYLLQLAAERAMNPALVKDDEFFADYVDEQSVTSKAMRIGTEREDDAKQLFSEQAGVEIDEVSSCKHDTIEHFAASPDGLIFYDMRPVACVEIKCPKQEAFARYATQITDAETLKAVMPQYYWQTQAEMECTGTNLCYFVAYNQWQKPSLHVAEIRKNEADCALMRERVMLANEHIENLVNAMRDGNTRDAIQSLRHHLQHGALVGSERMATEEH